MERAPHEKQSTGEKSPLSSGSMLEESSAGPVRISLPREDKLSAEAFHERYVTSLQPVILTGKMTDWPALSLWSPEYFATTFADVQQQVSINLPDTAVPSLHPWRQHLQTMTMAQFIQWMETSERPSYLDSTGLHRFAGEERHVDYSNIIWEDDGRSLILLWIGSANTRSGLHFDRYNNLLGQVYGSKKVCLVAPDQARYLYQFHDVVQKSHIDPEFPDLRRHPKFAEATVYEAVLNPGDMLFIPKLWRHSLRSLETSISINHWFCKDAGINEMLPLLESCRPYELAHNCKRLRLARAPGPPFRQETAL